VLTLGPENLLAYLEERDLIARGARIEAAGEGNINFVRRVRGQDGRSLIVKQARPALERFPEYRVTTERIVFEHRYTAVVARLAPKHVQTLPALLHFDESNRVLVMEDLGDCPDFAGELAAGRVPLPALEQLAEFLGAVHRASRAEAAALAPQFQNREMQALHGEHIFTLPYEPNTFPLAAETRAEGERLLARAGVRERIAELRATYYGCAEALVHADVQAGNIALQPERARLIDAEIAHVGDPAFDLGTLLAQIHAFAALAPHDPAFARAEARVLESYAGAAGHASPELLDRARGYAGVELLRRTLGAARIRIAEPSSGATPILARAARLLL